MLKIAANVIAGIISHAKNEAPIEACGYLAAREGVIVQQYKMKNMDASKIHYSLDPEEQFEVLKDMRAKGYFSPPFQRRHPAGL